MLNVKSKIYVLLGGMILTLTGCQTSLGQDPTNYTNAQEYPPLLVSPGSGPLSDRYNIPQVQNINEQIIIDINPPEFEEPEAPESPVVTEVTEETVITKE